MCVVVLPVLHSVEAMGGQCVMFFEYRWCAVIVLFLRAVMLMLGLGSSVWFMG